MRILHCMRNGMNRICKDMKRVLAILVSLFVAGVIYGQSGEVFVDVNGNGVKDKGEKGLSGARYSRPRWQRGAPQVRSKDGGEGKTALPQKEWKRRTRQSRWEAGKGRSIKSQAQAGRTSDGADRKAFLCASSDVPHASQ